MLEQYAYVLETTRDDEKRAEAGNMLQQMRNSLELPYDLCFTTLMLSKSQAAHYHAISIMRDGILREFGEALSRNDALRVQKDILEAAVGIEGLSRPVVSQLLAVYAVLVKRSWYVGQLTSTVSASGTVAEDGSTLRGGNDAANVDVNVRGPEQAEAVLGDLSALLSHSDDDDASSSTLNEASVLQSVASTETAFSLAKALIAEFSATSASSMKLPWEFHVRCHKMFEGLLLPHLWDMAMERTRNVCERLQQVLSIQTQQQQQQAANQGVLVSRLVDCAWASVSLLARVLEWEFDEETSHETFLMRASATGGARSTDIMGAMASGHSAQLDAAVTATSVRPGASWSRPLVEESPSDVLLRLLQHIGQCEASLSSSSTNSASSMRRALLRVTECVLNAVTQLASIKGAVVANPDMRTKHINTITEGTAAILSSLSQADLSDPTDIAEAQITGLCKVYHRLAKNMPLRFLLGNVEHAGDDGYLSQLRATTHLVLSPEVVVRFGAEAVDTWAAEAFDLLLEAWTVVVSGVEELSEEDGQQHQALSMLSSFTGGIVDTYVRIRLEVAAAEAVKGEGEVAEQFQGGGVGAVGTYLGDLLSSLAQVARVNPSQALHTVTAAIEERAGQLAAILEGEAQMEETTVLICHEGLWWLFEFLSHLLCDVVEGETPTIPSSLLALSREHYEAVLSKDPQQDPMVAAENASDSDPLVALMHGVFEVMSFQTKVLERSISASPSSTGQSMEFSNVKPPIVSPYVGTALLRLLDRWTQTYVMPDERTYGSRLSMSLVAAFSEEGKQCQGFLDQLLTYVQTNLLLWGEEPDIASTSCTLLASLIANKRIRRFIVSLPSFPDILAVYRLASLADPWFSSQQLELIASSTLPRVLDGIMASSSAAAREAGVSPEHVESSQVMFISSLVRLSPSSLSQLAASLATASGHVATKTQRLALLAEVCRPIHTRFEMLCTCSLLQAEDVTLLNADDIAEFAQHMSVTLSLARGVAKASGEQTQRACVSFLSRHFAMLIELIRFVRATMPSVSLAIVRLMHDIADSSLIYLPQEEAAGFIGTCVRLAHAYAEGNWEFVQTIKAKEERETGIGGGGQGEVDEDGQPILGRPTYVDDDVDDEDDTTGTGGSGGAKSMSPEEMHVEIITCLLALLQQVATRESLDLSSEHKPSSFSSKKITSTSSSSEGKDPFFDLFSPMELKGENAAALASGGLADIVANSVLSGLGALGPLLSQNLLAYPRLSERFFSLLSDAVATHPAKVLELPEDVVSLFLRSMAWGACCPYTGVARNAVRAVDELAGFRLGCIQSLVNIARNGNSGFPSSSTSSSAKRDAAVMEMVAKFKAQDPGRRGDSAEVWLAAMPFGDASHSFLKTMLQIVMFEPTDRYADMYARMIVCPLLYESKTHP